MPKPLSATTGGFLLPTAASSGTVVFTNATVVDYDASNERVTLDIPDLNGDYLRSILDYGEFLSRWAARWDAPRPRMAVVDPGFTTVEAPDSTTFADELLCEEPSTDGEWSSLRRMTAFTEESTDSNWSALARMTLFDEPSTDSEWSSVARMAGFLEPSTDSNWSSLVQMTPPVTGNRPPVWDPPAAFNVNTDDDVDIDLDNFCSDPDADSLTYTASESSSFYSESIIGSILTLDGGSTHRIDAGDIRLTANDGRGGTASVSVQVNVIDTTVNTPPVVEDVEAPWPRVIVTGAGGGQRLVIAAEQFVATDVDGDTIPTWDADPPNLWAVERAQALSTTTVPSAEQEGIIRLSSVQDYFATDLGSDMNGVYSSLGRPQDMSRLVNYRARCRDNRNAWSNYVTASIDIIQAVHGSRANVDTFQEEPDRRQPNIWAFRKGATTSMMVGGVHHQYPTPDEARDDKASWIGTLQYSARSLYRHISGQRPINSELLTRGIRNVHSSLTATKASDSDTIEFSARADAPDSDSGGYTSFWDWDVLCEVEVADGSNRSRYFWLEVTGFVFVTGDDPTTDSDWSSLVNFPREASTDSDWSSLVQFTLNSPPVCDPLPDRTVVNGQSTNVDVSTFLSDPDGDSITIEVSESDADISISNLNASAHSFTINGLSVGTATVTVTPIDELGLRGTACEFEVTVRDAVTYDCTPFSHTMLVGTSVQDSVAPLLVSEELLTQA